MRSLTLPSGLKNSHLSAMVGGIDARAGRDAVEFDQRGAADGFDDVVVDAAHGGGWLDLVGKTDAPAMTRAREVFYRLRGMACKTKRLRPSPPSWHHPTCPCCFPKPMSPTNWLPSPNGGARAREIVRTFSFPSYMAGISFVSEVARHRRGGQPPPGHARRLAQGHAPAQHPQQGRAHGSGFRARAEDRPHCRLNEDRVINAVHAALLRRPGIASVIASTRVAW